MDPKTPSSSGFASEREGTMSESTTERMKQTGAQAKDVAQQVVNEVRSGDTGKAMDDVKQRAADASGAASDRIDSAMTSTGEQFQNIAQRVRENAPTSGTMGNVATSAADALERSGSYLKQADVNQVRGDLESIIRQRPIESLLVGLGIGYLLARSMRR